MNSQKEKDSCEKHCINNLQGISFPHRIWNRVCHGFWKNVMCYVTKDGTKHAAFKANPVDSLQGFGQSRNGLAGDEHVGAELYLVQVKINGTACATMDDLMDHNYHCSKASPEKLPPTSHAIKIHILRAYYATNVMTSVQSQNSTKLNPLLYAYDEEDDLLNPEIGFRSIPEDWTAYCTFSKCATDSCACRRSGQACCQFCKC
ncbi:hypothetical protein SK128_015964 [Halocaridina rubra]|uniref:Uncharacterized protein n=1 Tax=Halocaridina rubra TaxID=373956 RepID=A0AAN9A996_HALRR